VIVKYNLTPINGILTQTVPAIQEEHVEDEVAPVTAEYVPASASGKKNR